ncbi:MAG: ABC transporter permease, partial [Eggerthellaceae bacterium]|nr:ABC transporter permease [Eggerthellaceae bacterium]
MRSIAYFVREALRGFTRNLSTTLGSIVTIFLSLLIIGVFLIGGIIVENVVSSVESEVSITAFIADDAPEEDIQDVMNFVRGLEGVSS